MDKQKIKLGFSGRLIRWSLTNEKNTFKSCNFMALGILVISIALLILGIMRAKSELIIYALAFGVLSSSWNQRAGFMELIEKEYTKNELEPGNSHVPEKAAKTD